VAENRPSIGIVTWWERGRLQILNWQLDTGQVEVLDPATAPAAQSRFQSARDSSGWRAAR